MKVPVNSFSFELRKSFISKLLELFTNESARSCDELLLERIVPSTILALSVSILMCLKCL